MSGLKTPVISIVIGEGGSGGALAMATADEVWMLENSIYSILSPEGFASILWKDSKRAKEAAGVMKLTANHLKSMEIVEQVIAEPEDFTTANLHEVTDRLDKNLKEIYMRVHGDGYKRSGRKKISEIPSDVRKEQKVNTKWPPIQLGEKTNQNSSDSGRYGRRDQFGKAGRRSCKRRSGRDHFQCADRI